MEYFVVFFDFIEFEIIEKEKIKARVFLQQGNKFFYFRISEFFYHVQFIFQSFNFINVYL